MSQVLTIIELKNVTKSYLVGEETINALDNCNFTVEKGSFKVITGPSGSGKSTLLNTVAGLVNITKGNVIIENKKVTEMSENQKRTFRKEKVGFIFQFFNLHQGLTAIENIELPLILSNVNITERRNRALTLLEKVNLIHRKDHYPVELSGGEQQRVAIARALANNPSIILADEPTGDLDEESRDQIINLLIKLNKDDEATIVMVTHDEDLITDQFDIIKIVDGKIINQGGEKNAY